MSKPKGIGCLSFNLDQYNFLKQHQREDSIEFKTFHDCYTDFR